MRFRKEIEREMGAELPPEGEPLPPDVEKRLSSMVAEAARRVTATAQAQAEQERIQQQQQDPLIQMKEREVAVKEADVQRKAQEGQAKIELDAHKSVNRDKIEMARIESQSETAGASIGQRIASDLLKAKQLEDKDAREDYKKGVDIGIDIAKDSNKND
jgi:hypothetical protein